MNINNNIIIFIFCIVILSLTFILIRYLVKFQVDFKSVKRIFLIYATFCIYSFLIGDFFFETCFIQREFIFKSSMSKAFTTYEGSFPWYSEFPTLIRELLGIEISHQVFLMLGISTIILTILLSYIFKVYIVVTLLSSIFISSIAFIIKKWYELEEGSFIMNIFGIEIYKGISASSKKIIIEEIRKLFPNKVFDSSDLKFLISDSKFDNIDKESLYELYISYFKNLKDIPVKNYQINSTFTVDELYGIFFFFLNNKIGIFSIVSVSSILIGYYFKLSVIVQALEWVSNLGRDYNAENIQLLQDGLNDVGRTISNNTVLQNSINDSLNNLSRVNSELISDIVNRGIATSEILMNQGRQISDNNERTSALLESINDIHNLLEFLNSNPDIINRFS